MEEEKTVLLSPAESEAPQTDTPPVSLRSARSRGFARSAACRRRGAPSGAGGDRAQAGASAPSDAGGGKVRTGGAGHRRRLCSLFAGGRSCRHPPKTGAVRAGISPGPAGAACPLSGRRRAPGFLGDPFLPPPSRHPKAVITPSFLQKTRRSRPAGRYRIGEKARRSGFSPALKKHLPPVAGGVFGVFICCYSPAKRTENPCSA